ncbi:GNAT family N-acetyltransferase [Bacillus wiedmannii]|uniref:GNAT family N-acetyltransferase n=1 Tax=Bacillus wiedmannii TaxID=1890302 RepID=UPI000BF5CBB8|nr:GNAT family protein [Bacillus wiedmannii]PFY98364.1 GNAT family N-acetyltransferase [Bacillus wiedmannii]
MQSQVILNGEKVILRDLKQEDIKEIYYWIYQSPNREHLKWNAPYHPKKEKSIEMFYEEDYKNHFMRIDKNLTRSKLVIEVEGKLIGTVGWYWVDKLTNWLCNGIVIFDSNYWAGGYGTEAFSLWTDYIFENMNVERVGISTWSGNERMIALAKKVGMKLEGEIRKARIVNGEYFDSIKMGILREEWNKCKNTK